jgi:hypothetical protein
MDSMSGSRREFIKGVGVALAALATVRCRPLSSRQGTLRNHARDRLRDCWMRLDWLAEETQNAKMSDQGEEARDQLVQDHQSALNELIAKGELEGGVAIQVQTAFDAAVYHVWRSNAPMTCYEAVMVDYKPISSSQLVKQARWLAQTSDLDPDTLTMAQAAISRDVAFLNLSGDEIQVLYERLRKMSGDSYDFPPYEELELEVSPEAMAAAQFLVELLLAE